MVGAVTDAIMVVGMIILLFGMTLGLGAYYGRQGQADAGRAEVVVDAGPAWWIDDGGWNYYVTGNTVWPSSQEVTADVWAFRTELRYRAALEIHVEPREFDGGLSDDLVDPLNIGRTFNWAFKHPGSDLIDIRFGDRSWRIVTTDGGDLELLYPDGGSVSAIRTSACGRPCLEVP